MESVPSYVDETPGRRSRRQVLSRRKPLVRGARQRCHHDQATQTGENAYHPTPHVGISGVDSAPFPWSPCVRKMHADRNTVQPPTGGGGRPPSGEIVATAAPPCACGDRRIHLPSLVLLSQNSESSTQQNPSQKECS